MTSQRIYFWFLLDNFRDYINRIWSLILCWVTAGCVLYNLLYRPVNHGKWFFNTTQPDCSLQTWGRGTILYIPVYPNYVSKSSSVVNRFTCLRSLRVPIPQKSIILQKGLSDTVLLFRACYTVICWLYTVQYSMQLSSFENNRSHY